MQVLVRNLCAGALGTPKGLSPYYTIPRVMLNYLKVTVVLCKRIVKVCYKLPFIRG